MTNRDHGSNSSRLWPSQDPSINSPVNLDLLLNSSGALVETSSATISCRKATCREATIDEPSMITPTGCGGCSGLMPISSSISRIKLLDTAAMKPSVFGASSMCPPMIKLNFLLMSGRSSLTRRKTQHLFSLSLTNTHGIACTTSSDSSAFGLWSHEKDCSIFSRLDWIDSQGISEKPEPNIRLGNTKSVSNKSLCYPERSMSP